MPNFFKRRDELGMIYEALRERAREKEARGREVETYASGDQQGGTRTYAARSAEGGRRER